MEAELVSLSPQQKSQHSAGRAATCAINSRPKATLRNLIEIQSIEEWLGLQVSALGLECCGLPALSSLQGVDRSALDLTNRGSLRSSQPSAPSVLSESLQSSPAGQVLQALRSVRSSQSW